VATRCRPLRGLTAAKGFMIDLTCDWNKDEDRFAEDEDEDEDEKFFFPFPFRPP